MGRPFVKKQLEDVQRNESFFKEEAIRKLEEVFALDGTISEACFYAGISRETYYKWTRDNPKMAERFEELRNRPVLVARQTLFKALKESPEYAFKYLERKRRKEFGNNVEVNTNLTFTRIEKIEMIQPSEVMAELDAVAANAATLIAPKTPVEGEIITPKEDGIDNAQADA